MKGIYLGLFVLAFAGMGSSIFMAFGFACMSAVAQSKNDLIGLVLEAFLFLALFFFFCVAMERLWVKMMR